MNNDIAFRPLSYADLPLLQRWLSEPHVDAWWHTLLDLAGVHAKYGPRIDGTEPTYTFIIENRDRPIGWIQWYWWLDYPEHAVQLEASPDSAGVDLAIGEPDMVGLGLGPAVIREFVTRIVFANPNVSAVISDVEQGNSRSLRAFEKAGFAITKGVQIRGENVLRRIVRMDHPAFGSAI